MWRQDVGLCLRIVALRQYRRTYEAYQHAGTGYKPPPDLPYADLFREFTLQRLHGGE